MIHRVLFFILLRINNVYLFNQSLYECCTNNVNYKYSQHRKTKLLQQVFEKWFLTNLMSACLDDVVSCIP